MLPKDESPITPTMGTLYITDLATGEETPLGPVNDISETIIPETINLEAVHRINHAPGATFTFNFRSKRMTRKRFVKKLMADCVPRNIANDMADLVLVHGHTYAWGYFVICVSGVLPWKED